MKYYPKWSVLSLVANGLFVLAIAGLLWRKDIFSTPSMSNVSVASVSVPTATPTPVLGERLYLNYAQWVELLEQEAQVVAKGKQENLYILLGDSISLWFPPEYLPPEEVWLNQGISGETSLGLLRRLELLDDTNPKAIFIMIGINDLLRGVKTDTIVSNQKLAIRYLRRTHPNTKLVVQSILPHGAEKATWEGRDRLLKIPNSQIDEINQRLSAIAAEEDAIYLDLYSLFADEQGNLRTELSTDGLHLNPKGYQLWRLALQICNQLEIE